MIEMYCDHCEELIDEAVSGGVRLKTGKKEYTFHLCERCQGKLRKQVLAFIQGGPWRET